MKCRVLRVVFAVAIFLNPIAAFHASSSILRQTLQSSSSHGTSRKTPISPKVLTKYPQSATRQSARRNDQVGADVVSESFGRERSEDVGEVVLAELDDIDADALFATKQAVQALRDGASKAQSLLDVRTAAAVRIDRRGVVPSLVAVDALSAPLPLLPSSSSPSPPLVPPHLLLVTRNLKAATELAAHLQVGGKELVNGNPVIEPEWIFLTNGARSSSSSSSSKSPNAWAKKLMGFAARHRLGVCVHSLEAAEALQAEAFAASSRRDTAASSRTSKSGFNKKNKFKKESEIESRKYGGDSGGRGDDGSRRGGGRHKDGGLEDASPSLRVTVDVYLSKQFVENSCQLSPDRKTTPDGGEGSNQDDDDDDNNNDDGEGLGEGLGGVWKAMAVTHPNLVLRGFVSGGLVAAPATSSNTESTNLRDGDLLNDDDDDDASDDLFCLRDAAADVWRCGGVCPGGLRLLLPASTLSDEEEEAAGGGGTAAGRNTNIFGVEKEVSGPLRMNRAVIDCAGGARSAFDEVVFVEEEAQVNSP